MRSIKKECKLSSNPKSMMSAKEYKEHLKGHCKLCVFMFSNLFSFTINYNIVNIIAPPQDQLSFYDNSNRSNEIK